MMDSGTPATFGSVATKDGVSLFYTVQGSEDAPWLIVSNSLATTHAMWDLQVAELSKIRRVLRYDTRSHGRSSVPDADYGFDTLADDVIAMMDSLGIPKADIMGLSMGGMTALAVAINHPSRIEKMICCDARADAPDPYKAMWDGNIAKVRETGSTAALVEPTLERWFTEAFRSNPANAAALDKVRDMILGTSAAGYLRAATCLRSLDLLKDLPSITSPSLFVAGDSDPAAPLPVMQEMADKTPGGTLAVVPHAAHLSNIEQPEAFTATVAGFLKD